MRRIGNTLPGSQRTTPTELGFPQGTGWCADNCAAATVPSAVLSEVQRKACQPMSELFSPLPGTQAARCGLFLDVWGTLCEFPDRGYAASPDDVRFFPGALDALFGVTRSGFVPYLLGNEDGVAFGHVDDLTWKTIETRLLDGLSEAGIELGRSYLCLDHPEGKKPHRGESVYMLPGTGAFFQASHMDGIDLERSWVVGDSTLELVAGWRAGLRCAAVRTGRALADRTFQVELDLDAPDLLAVLSHLRQAAPRRAA